MEMLRCASLLLIAVLGFAAAYSTGGIDNDRYNSNNQNQQTWNSSQVRTKDIFCFLNYSNIAVPPYHDIGSDTRRPFTVNDIRSDLCTHIVYNAVRLDLNQNTIKAFDIELERNSGSRPTFSELTKLKERNSHLKLILSVSAGPSDFSALAHNGGQLAAFAANVNHYLKNIRFDGLNIDWKYPSREDKLPFTDLMKNLKSALRTDGFLLTTVIPPHKTIIQETYDHPAELFENVDYWFIMAIDLSYKWYNIRAPAPMDTTDGDGIIKVVTDLKKIFNQYSYKLILAIPFGGKQITSNHEIMEHESPYGKGKSQHEEPFAYNKLCKTITRGAWSHKWNDREQVPYAHMSNRVFIYDDAESVKIKTQYAIRNGLGGVMAYTIDMDDYEGACTNSGPGYSNKKYNDQTYRVQDRSATSSPLLQSIYDTIQRDPNSAGVHTSSLALVLAIAVAMILKHHG